MTGTESCPIAADFMEKHVKTVSPDTPLSEVVRFLLDHGLSNTPVVEMQNGKRMLVGFLSERDCLAALTQESFYGDPPPSQSAGTVMRRSPICVSSDTDLFALASVFINHGYRHLPVTEHGELKGIVSRRDVLQAVDKHYAATSDKKLHERFRPNLREIMNLRFIMTRG